MTCQNLSIQQQREALLATIADAKRQGISLNSKIVKDALWQLHLLDDNCTIAFEPTQRAQFSNDGHYSPPRTPLADNVAFTLNGELTTITFEPDAGTYDTDLGFEEPATAEDEEISERNQRFADAADLLSEIVRWLVGTRGEINAVGARGLALGAMLQPHCGGTEPTMAALARKFGVTRACLQKHARELRRLAHGIFQGRCQANAELSELHRQRAIRQHIKAGHRIGERKSKRQPQHVC